jgi:hypothetical protein
MSDKEEVVEEVAPPPKTKPVRKKRVLTEEERERLRENLKKGRETALRNRQKRALANKIEREEMEKQRDQKIAKHILGVVPEKEKIEEIKEEIKTLKSEGGHGEEIKVLKSQIKLLTDVLQGVIDKTNSKPKKEEPKPEPEPEPEPEPKKHETNYKIEPAKPAPIPQPKPIVNPQPERKVFQASKRKKNKDAFF